MADHMHGKPSPSYLRPQICTPPPTAMVGTDPLENFIANFAFGLHQAGRIGRCSTSIGNRQRGRHRFAPITLMEQAGWHTKTFCISDGIELVFGSNGVVEVQLKLLLCCFGFLVGCRARHCLDQLATI